MIAFLLSRTGAYIAGGLAILIILGGLYHKIQTDAVDSERAKAAEDALRRVEDANSAADAARNSPNRVRELDKQFCRDC